MNVKILLICNIARGNILILEEYLDLLISHLKMGWQLDDKRVIGQNVLVL